MKEWGQCVYYPLWSFTLIYKILLIFPGVDGGFSRWGFWSDCSLTCGGGVQTRTRTCTHPPPQGYGKGCDGPMQETRACNDTPCPEGKHSTWVLSTRQWGNLKTQQKSARKITLFSWSHRFRKVPLSKCFKSTLKRKVSAFKPLRFEERFQKAPFSWRTSVDGKSNLWIKVALSNSAGVVWTERKLTYFSLGVHHRAFRPLAMLKQLVADF